MKITTIIRTMTMISIVFYSSTVFADYYYSAGIGDGGDAKTNSFSIEAGRFSTTTETSNYLFAVSVPFIDHGDIDVPGGTIIDAPSPHTNITTLGEKNDGLETGLIGKAGKGFMNGTVFLSFIGGVTQSNIVEVAKSNVGDEYYEQSTDREIYGVYGAGVSYFKEFFDWGLKMNFQIDYDNRRGVTGSIGMNW